MHGSFALRCACFGFFQRGSIQGYKILRFQKKCYTRAGDPVRPEGKIVRCTLQAARIKARKSCPRRPAGKVTSSLLQKMAALLNDTYRRRTGSPTEMRSRAHLRSYSALSTASQEEKKGPSTQSLGHGTAVRELPELPLRTVLFCVLKKPSSSPIQAGKHAAARVNWEFVMVPEA